MITSYNESGVGDVLLVVINNSNGQDVKAVRHGDVAQVTVVETGEVVAWNLFNASTHVSDLSGNGQLILTDGQINQLNDMLTESGFETELVADNSPKFVVGFVKSCQKHDDSDHLHITQIEVDNGDILQIVCGAPNIKAGLKVVVAKVGAMMPDGLIIWSGELRGVASHGMVCSAKELGLPNAPTKKGILELPFDAKVGSSFSVDM